MSKFVINGKEVAKDFWEQSNTGIVIFISEEQSPKTGHSTRHKTGNNFPGLGEVKESRVSNMQDVLKNKIGFDKEELKNFIEENLFKSLEYSKEEIEDSIKNINSPYVNPKHFKAEGVKHSEGKTPMELDFDFIRQMAERMASNKSNGKYKPFNWKSTIDIRSLKDAVMRHMLEIMEGRYEDDGREYGHIEAAATGLMMINYQLKNK